MSRKKRLLLGCMLAACLLGLVEVGARIFWGDPPISKALWHTTRCQLREELGQSWIECRWLHGKVDRWSVLDNPAEKTRPRVVVLGGSSVYNSNDENPHVNFSRVLQRLLPEVEVINLGTPGMDSAGVLWMSDQAKALKPDLLVVYTGHNDFSEMVFMGKIRGTRLWMIPLQQALNESWIYTALALQDWGGTPVFQNAPGTKNPDQPAICPKKAEEPDLFVRAARRARIDGRHHWMAGVNREALIPVEDGIAFDVREQLNARLESNLTSIVRNSDVPVILMTLLRNFDHMPTGVLVSHRERCRRALGCLSTIGRRVPEALVGYSGATCGESSITAWLESLVARREGNFTGAVDAFHRSLDLDPLPLRAPSSADRVIRNVARATGAPLVDLDLLLGPILPGEWFTDNLHLSPLGTRKVAAVLTPVVESALQGTRSE